MSKNVWASLPLLQNLNIYRINMRISDVYNYPTLMKLQVKIGEKLKEVAFACDEELGKYGVTMKKILVKVGLDSRWSMMRCRLVLA